ncbi:MAG TPA: tRNA(His) guanylyltransferase Thg1 family protein [Herpetosiphonaceae bacterium]|nr:tRNA(His) guanylyltransferase Thg1 family protein [Herpetosiphonaceae bacterium]
MRFDELDRTMRVFETAHDHCVLPGIWMVARIDGRSFTRLTKETLAYERPFDARFRDAMADTVEHLMQCGFQALYGYTQSDEISLLFGRDETVFGRKLRKYNSILAGEASARFSLSVGVVGAFDCRIVQLPADSLVIDYFRWRQEDAHRNALNAHCYWKLRDDGLSVAAATARTSAMSVAQKNELLFGYGVNFNDLPAWQRRGVGLHWESYAKPGLDPRTGQPAAATRQRIRRELDLPMKDAYDAFIARRMRPAEPV